ncbi:unnamed protein product, partial [Discosporangium mesarthrocarpum]
MTDTGNIPQEHHCALALYLLLLGPEYRGLGQREMGKEELGQTGLWEDEVSRRDVALGKAMTFNGPPPFMGRILDSPDLLWADDSWTPMEEEEAQRVLNTKGPPIKTFWKEKYERDSQKNWDRFYKRHGVKFFKDRHYLGKVFPELAPPIFTPSVPASEAGRDGDNQAVTNEEGPGLRPTCPISGCNLNSDISIGNAHGGNTGRGREGMK